MLTDDENGPIQLDHDPVGQVIQYDPLPPFSSVGTNDHEVVVPPLGFSQDLVHYQAVAHLGSCLDAQTLQTLNVLCQQHTLGSHILDQFLGIRSQGLAFHPRPGAHLRHYVQDRDFFLPFQQTG